MADKPLPDIYRELIEHLEDAEQLHGFCSTSYGRCVDCEGFAERSKRLTDELERLIELCDEADKT